jgi:hypothetical protein
VLRYRHNVHTAKKSLQRGPELKSTSNIVRRVQALERAIVSGYKHKGPFNECFTNSPAYGDYLMRSDALINYCVQTVERTPRMEKGCQQCRGFVENYMVWDNIWFGKFGMEANQILCIGCVEKKIGRKIRFEEFVLKEIRHDK